MISLTYTANPYRIYIIGRNYYRFFVKGYNFMRFVHTADNHLDLPCSSLPPHKAEIRRGMRLASFSKIIEYTKHNADMLLISGDLFDSPNPPRSVLSFVANEFEKLNNIPVFISLGNHDYYTSAFNFPGNVHIFPGEFESVTYRDCRITGASFTAPSADFAHLIPPSGDGYSNILLLHGDIFTKSDYNPMNKETLSSYGYDYIALGHVHDFSRYKSIAYPGCHDGAGFDETGEKCFIYGEVSNHGLTLSTIPSSSLIYSRESFDISPYSSSSQIADAICEKYSDGIYRFSLTGTPREGFIPNADAIGEYISHKFFHATVTDNTSDSSTLSDSLLCKLFSEYIASHAQGEVASLALKYGLSALRGDVDL